MPQVRETQTLSCMMHYHAKTVQSTSTTLAAKQEAETIVNQKTNQGNQHRVGSRTVGQRRVSPVRDGLSDKLE